MFVCAEHADHFIFDVRLIVDQQFGGWNPLWVYEVHNQLQNVKLFIKPKLGDWVIGPAIPHVGRVRGYYLLDFLVKLERESKKISYAKKTILESAQFMQSKEGFSGVRVNIDVDPYWF